MIFRKIMSKEEISNNSGTKTPSKDQKPDSGFKVNVLNFLKRNFAAVVLTIVLILVFIWFSVKIDYNKNHFENEKTQLITQYETERDSLQIKNLAFASSVFSWSIRSEMLRNNMENLNQLLTIFVQESAASMVQIVNPDTRVVILSSDKKYEGTEYDQEVNFEINHPVVIKDDQKISIITPIMGFSNRIGVLIVDVK
jgi:Ca2+/Na+ antiporter